MIGLYPRIRGLIVFVLVSAVLAACAPLPPSSPDAGNLTLEVRRLSSEINRQGQALNDLSRRLESAEQRLLDQDAQLQELRYARSGASSAGSSPVGNDRPTGSQTGSLATGFATTAGTPTEIYLQAFGDYASGRYQQAAEGFQMFLQRFPDNSYASNAQFWLGDCFFNQQDYAMAIQVFQKSLDQYPRAPKAADALLKIAMAQRQLGHLEEARQSSETLIRLYPGTAAAKKAADLNLP